MIEITSIEDIELLRETNTLECKLAGGRDGKGELPKDFWPTYSAFANTFGGTILLGVSEKDRRFKLTGIENVRKLREELFNSLNNPQKVSCNLLTDADVEEVTIDGKNIILVRVPRATRQFRPVFTRGNPFGGNTYKRTNEADKPYSDQEVKNLFAEQADETRDGRLLKNFDLSDLSDSTLWSYRQVFSDRNGGTHPFSGLTDIDFLRRIGGWTLDRESGDEGLTVAGLLMFGQSYSIQEALPNYMLDYQERPEAKTENRWVDRLTLDGTWSGNLYDFYRRVYSKLTAELKVPFTLVDGQRLESTPVHIALREALANALVHADYTEKASVLIVKRPDMFGFRNPGLMRVPPEVAIKGGEADCRNRNLHKMFRFVGIGEQAGTGIPKIFQEWKSQHWQPPKLVEKETPSEQTLLELRMLDLFPSQILASLHEQFGKRFNQLSTLEQTALALAAAEGTVNHARLSDVSTEHPNDISRALHSLCQGKMLLPHGAGRGAVYHIYGIDMPSAEDIFGETNLGSSSQGSKVSSQGLQPHVVEVNSFTRDLQGRMVHSQLRLPVVDSLEKLEEPLLSQLLQFAQEPRKKKKVAKAVMEEAILNLCHDQFLTLEVLASLVDRQKESLRNEYLSKLVKQNRLKPAFPQTPTHPNQAYCSAESLG